MGRKLLAGVKPGCALELPRMLFKLLTTSHQNQPKLGLWVWAQAPGVSQAPQVTPGHRTPVLLGQAATKGSEAVGGLRAGGPAGSLPAVAKLPRGSQTLVFIRSWRPALIKSPAL